MKITEINPLPESVLRWGRCLMLHERIPHWDGTYRFDEATQKHVPDIKYVCKECNNHE